MDRTSWRTLRALLASLPPDEATAIVSRLTPKDKSRLRCWSFLARDAQLPPPGNWRKWFIKAGRGFGKTRSAAEYIIEQARTKQAKRIGIIAPTAADVRDICIEGESGILSISPPDFRPLHFPSLRRLVWPNGAIATTYSAEEPDRLRGPQHDLLWCEEVASWEDTYTWDMAMFGLRLGKDPRAVITGTPKPTKLIKQLLADPACIVTGGSTYDNMANLAPAFIDEIVKKYEGTDLGRQELYAEVIEEGGLIYLPAWWQGNRYQHGDQGMVQQAIARYISWDTALKDKESSAYSAYIVGELMPDYRLVIREVWRGKLQFPDLVAWMRRTAERFNADDKLHGMIIEDKASGTSAYQTLIGADDWLSRLLIPFMPMADKPTRGRQSSLWVQKGCILLPEPGPTVPWLLDFTEELHAAPHGEYWDQADTFAQLVLYLEHLLAEGWRARNRG